MKKLWKTNTAIFSLQILGYVITIVFFDEGNIEKARIVESLIAVGVAVAAGLFMLVGDELDKEVRNLTILLLAASAAIIQLPRDLIPGDSIMVFGAFACLPVAVWRERVENESIFWCFVTALPGTGIFIGGIILFYRWLRRQPNYVPVL